jgi:hypothetical protein
MKPLCCQISQMPDGAGVVLPVASEIDLSKIELCEQCKSNLITVFSGAYKVQDEKTL